MAAVRGRLSLFRTARWRYAAMRLFRRAGGSSLGTKLGGTIVLCMLAGLGVGAVVFVRQVQVQADARSRQAAHQAVAEALEAVQQATDSAIEALETRGAAVATLWAHDVRDRRIPDVLLAGLLENVPDRLGAWIAWTPAALAGMPGAESGKGVLDVSRHDSVVTREASRDNDPAVRMPLETAAAFAGEPHAVQGPTHSIAAISLSAPIVVDGKVIAAIGVDVSVRSLLDAIAKATSALGARVLLVSRGGAVAGDETAGGRLRTLRDVRPDLLNEMAAARRDRRYRADQQTARGPVSVGWSKLAGLGGGWFARVEVPVATFDPAAQPRSVVIPLAGVVAAITIGVMLSLRLVVTRPLERIEAFVKTLGGGQDADCPGTRRNDEIGAIARALSAFRDAEGEVGRLRRTEQERETLYADARRAELQELANHLAATVQSVAGLVESTSRKIMRRAEAMTAATVASASRTKDIADASKAADASVGDVDAAAIALRQAIARIDTEVAQTRAIASQAAERARLSGEVTEALSSQASRIGEIVALISSIAQRTNMLALNAAIEAARAGETGRGFAVVAQEVKALATQTTAATIDVGRQIEAMQKTATEAAAALSTIRDHVATIDTISGAVAGAVQDQGDATDLIGRSVGSAVAASRGVSQAIGEVDRAATQAGDAATEMLIDIAQLSDEVGRLDDEVRDVIARIRAA